MEDKQIMRENKGTGQQQEPTESDVQLDRIDKTFTRLGRTLTSYEARLKQYEAKLDSYIKMQKRESRTTKELATLLDAYFTALSAEHETIAGQIAELQRENERLRQDAAQVTETITRTSTWIVGQLRGTPTIKTPSPAKRPGNTNAP
jgi:chromosome segregation ATPase